MYHIMMSHKDVVDGINWKFNDYVEQYKRGFSFYDKESIYIRAFRHYLVLSEYGIFPEKASIYLNTLTKLHFGYNLDEIHEFTLTVGRNNVYGLLGREITPLGDKEQTAVLEYHKILFGKFKKNDEPFNITV